MVEPRILSRFVYFAAVVETQSFTKAAERLGITKAVVSQQVARLEEDLGTALLVRTTRRVEPTEAGRLLHGRAAAILREAGDAVAEATRGNDRPHGTLRVLAPADYGALRIVPILAEFLRRYPECRADLRLGDRITDLLEGEIDLSIRVGWLADTSLHARRLGTFEQLLVAAPSLAARVKEPRAPEELATLPLIVNTVLPQATAWRFTGPDGEEVVVDARSLLSVDTARGVHAAVLAGLGHGILPDFMVTTDIAEKRLVRVLPNWRLPTGGIHAVFPASRLRPTRVSAFVAMLMSSMQGDLKQAG
ncbi:LysR family transcriptional regulator [Fulvimarina endophytica]|uniref:LysR family transcriptional regulator n=1 Tax=Fulvimarina endophytica TaxID=2293836 RepID=A0A371X2T1_9HYPH|nr:LysR family transcriptional regulator [Fulvimarina endophytica]RFC63540.1 LysR family transcriptional regulator [Fulvimarina endophytica]